MKALRIPSLILAAVLQVLPLARVAAVLQQPATPLWAILLRWAGSAAAALGSIQAVSGASTTITNPLNATGTNGIPFKQFRLTTAPDQAHYWTASGLPSGLSLSGKSGQTFWAIIGTPTSPGTFNVRLMAKDEATSGADRTVAANLVITILDQGTIPTIATQPFSQSVVAGSPATFTVSANGTAPLSYQWKKNGADIGGANSSTLFFPATTATDAGIYTVLVSNSLGSALSQGATLTVTTPTQPPVITAAPADQTVTAGARVTFSVAASSTAPLTYQWIKDGVDINGATSPSLVLPSVTTADSGAYTVRVSNSAGSVVSGVANLTVNNPVSLPVITTGPQSRTLYAGQSVTLSASATGSDPLSYKWFHGTTAISGATDPTLTLTSVDSSAAGDYSVEVSNAAGAVRSPTATITVTVLQILSVTENGDSTLITWNGIAGQKYRIMAVNALGESWQPLTVEPLVDASGVAALPCLTRCRASSSAFRPTRKASRFLDVAEGGALRTKVLSSCKENRQHIKLPAAAVASFVHGVPPVFSRVERCSGLTFPCPKLQRLRVTRHRASPLF